jgi:DNA polymerase
MGEGNLDAQVVIVGGAPGYNEDLAGKPFVGKAGDLMQSFFDASETSREDVYLLNIVGCWPTDAAIPKKSRNPTRTEIKSCVDLVHRTIEIIDPYVLLLLGSTALKTMTREKRTITKIARDDRIPVITSYTQGLQMEVPRAAFATFHPATLLEKWDPSDGGDIDLSLRTWQRAFWVADKHSQIYTGTTPRLGT